MPIHADSVILNANVITMNPAAPECTAVAVKDGRFLAMGEWEDVTAFISPATETMDAGGKTVLPGFIDAHTHVMSSGIRHVAQEDCDLRSIGEIQEGLKGRAVDTPAGEWVLGFKFDDTKTSEQRFLHRRELDAVSDEHPVMVAHQAGHVYFFNTLGLRQAVFNDDTPDPSGGRLGRDPDTGELDGRVYGAAIYPVLREVLPSPHRRRPASRPGPHLSHVRRSWASPASTTPWSPTTICGYTRRPRTRASFLSGFTCSCTATTSLPSATRAFVPALATTGSASGGSRWWLTGP